MNKKKRGRPIGFKLSDETKKAISQSKQGQKHSEETKDKISKSLIAYFRRQKPLSEEIINMYCRVGDDNTCDWVVKAQRTLDEAEEIKTFRAILNAERYENACGSEIEWLSHDMNPETLVLFKEYCECNGFDMDELFDEILNE